MTSSDQVDHGTYLVEEAARFRSGTALLRRGHAELLIVKARTLGYGDDIVEKVLGAIFPGGSAEYWSLQLSEPMEVHSFVHRLCLHQIDPSEKRQYGPFNTQTRIEFALRGTLRGAFDSKEPFFIGNGRIEPRAAVEWIASKPLRCEYLPPSLRTYLGAKSSAVEPLTIDHEPNATAAIESPRLSTGVGRPKTIGKEIEAWFDGLRSEEKQLPIHALAASAAVDINGSDRHMRRVIGKLKLNQQDKTGLKPGQKF